MADNHLAIDRELHDRMLKRVHDHMLRVGGLLLTSLFWASYSAPDLVEEITHPISSASRWIPWVATLCFIGSLSIILILKHLISPVISKSSTLVKLSVALPVLSVLLIPFVIRLTASSDYLRQASGITLEATAGGILLGTTMNELWSYLQERRFFESGQWSEQAKEQLSPDQ